MKKILDAALETAALDGAVYADARFGCFDTQVIATRDQMIQHLSDSTESGLCVRAYIDGAWGQASGELMNEDAAALLGKRAVEIARLSARINRRHLELTPLAAYVAEWRPPVRVDPFSVPLKQKTDLLLEINGRIRENASVQEAHARMHFKRSHKLFASTLGSFLDQMQIWSSVDFSAVAVGNGRFVSRDYQGSPRQIGWEGIEGQPVLEEAPRVAREAVEKLTAPEPTEERIDLILLPSHTRLIIHETIGHALELDRILGWEADYAGTSFATREKLGTYRYGSEIFNVTADRTRDHGMASCGYDDDGVPCGRWPMISGGILMDYAATRDTAPLAGFDRSRACAYADNWSSFPILRMPNVCIDPGPAGSPSLEQLIADTSNGILVDGMDSYSIDHQRINFQFGGDYCRRIRNGRVEEPLYNVTYEGSNPSFWSSVDAICGESEWRPAGIYGCAKGQPVQITALTHGSSPLRLRNITLRRQAP